MKKKNTAQTIALSLFIIILIFSGLFYLYINSKTTPKQKETKLYYYDPVSMELVPETITMELPDNTELKLIKIIEQLKKPPQNKGLFPILNKEAKVNSISMDNGICTVDFNEDATLIHPLSVKKEAIRVYGIVNTLTEIPNIHAVQILINGEKRQYFSHYIQVYSPLTHISSSLPDAKTINLYFASPDLNNILLEKREIVASQDPTTLGKEILRELLFGSTQGLKNSIPNDTKINNFYIKSGGIGVVDFDESILSHHVGSHSEQLIVMSIVNSLTELPDIQSVQILIDGKEINTLFGSVDTSTPIQRFFGITQDTDVIVPYYIYVVNNKEFFCPVVKTIEHGKNQITALFGAIKNPLDQMKTYLPTSALLKSFSTKENGTLISLNIECKTDNPDSISKIAEQLALSFTELPDISRVEITINGERMVTTR